MVREWRVLYRAGEWAGLSEEELSEFYSLVTDINQEKMKFNSNLNEYSDEYFEYLNSEVLSDQRVIDFLSNSSILDSKLPLFRHKKVPLEELFKARWQLDYDLDRIVDFLMIIKLVDEFSQMTGKEYMEPRNKLQSLVYLVNSEISGEEDGSVDLSSENMGLGMLRKTGYRYLFRKGNNGPIASSLRQDIDILHAHDLVQEDVVVVNRPGVDEPFGLKIGQTGTLLLKRFNNTLAEFDSVLLQEWNLAQRRIINRYGNMSQEELSQEIQSLSGYQNKRTGSQLVSPRMDFSKAPETDQGIVEETV